MDPGSDKGPPLHTSWQRSEGAQAEGAVVSQLVKEDSRKRRERDGKGLRALRNSGRRTTWLQRVLGARRVFRLSRNIGRKRPCH